MAVLALWLGHEARARWRPMLACALLVAVTSATVLAAVAGALRGATAVDRLMGATRPATAEVVPNQPGINWDRVRALPGVAALTTFPAYSSLPTDTGPADTGPADTRPADTPSALIPADAQAMRTIEVPVVLAGRLPDPASPAEAVITPQFARATGRGVGATVTARLMTPAQADASFRGDQSSVPAGPVVRLRVVGIVRSLWFGDDVGDRGTLIPSPGLFARYRANFLGATGSVPLNAIVRLHDGAAGLPAFKQALARVTGNDAIDVADRAALATHYRGVTGFESGCLLAFALAALLAGLVLAGQAIARLAAASVAELRLVVPTGLTRRQGAVLAAAGPGLAAAAGALAGAAVAVAASRWLPFGVAATKEPHPGVDADWRVLAAGIVVFPVLATGIAVASGWLGLRARPARAAARPGAVAALARTGLPAPAIVGAWLALAPGRGPRAVPARAAMLGSVVGVLGVVATLTFAAGVADAAANPARFGQDYQLLVVFGSGGRDFAPAGPVLRALAADPEVTGVTNIRIGAGRAGSAQVLVHSYDPVGAPVPLVLAAGAAPERPGDLVLAPATARRLGAGVGSVVPLAGDRGGRRLRVTGVGFTLQTSTAGYDDGGWISRADYDALFSGFKEHGGLIAVRPATGPAGPALGRAQAIAQHAAGGHLLVLAPFIPRQVGEIADIRLLPAVLAAFLALLAAAAVGYALLAAVSRWSRDIAVLRALGMTPAQARLTAMAQATVFTTIGLAAGIPLGLAAGRALWRLAAGLVPLQYLPPAPATLLLSAIPATLACGLALAVVPGHRAARLPAGAILRGE